MGLCEGSKTLGKRHQDWKKRSLRLISQPNTPYNAAQAPLPPPSAVLTLDEHPKAHKPTAVAMAGLFTLAPAGSAQVFAASFENPRRASGPARLGKLNDHAYRQ